MGWKSVTKFLAGKGGGEEPAAVCRPMGRGENPGRDGTRRGRRGRKSRQGGGGISVWGITSRVAEFRRSRSREGFPGAASGIVEQDGWGGLTLGINSMAGCR